MAEFPTEQAGMFDAYAAYYDLLYHGKDYVGEAAYIRAVLLRNGLAEGELLEFGSGTGKHGRLLAEMGYRVHGVEISAKMVAQSHQTKGFKCQQGDICAIQMGRTYDAVLSLFHVVSYQTTNVRIQAVFARAAEHLSAGGLFVFDFWYSPAVYSQRPAVRVKRMAYEQVDIIRIAEPVIYPNENQVEVNYTIYAHDLVTGTAQTFTETHPMRHFSLPEIDLLAETHGFHRIEAEEFLTGNPAGEGTWGVCVTLKRN